MHHLASYLALGAALLFIGFRLYRHFSKKRSLPNDQKPYTAYIFSFICGALVLNGAVHLLHGASGDNFAAPFSFATQNILFKHVLNVLWGMLNILFAYVLSFQATTLKPRYRASIFLAGMTVMALILCFVFS